MKVFKRTVLRLSLHGLRHEKDRLFASPNGTFFITVAKADTSITVFGCLPQLKRLWELRGHTSQVTCVTMGTDNKTVAAGSLDGSIRVWCPETGACLIVIEGADVVDSTVYGLEAGVGVQCIAFSPDCSSLASGGSDRLLKQWLVQGQAPIAPLCTFTGHTGTVSSVVYASAAQLVSGGDYDDHSIRIWDVASGACSQVVLGLSDVWGLSVSMHDIVFGYAYDSILRVWTQGERGAKWEGTSKVDGREYGISCIAVSPRLPMAVTSTMDETLHVWDLETGACKAILEHPRGVVLALVMVGDASVISVGCHGQSRGGLELYLWQLYV